MSHVKLNPARIFNFDPWSLYKKGLGILICIFVMNMMPVEFISASGVAQSPDGPLENVVLPSDVTLTATSINEGMLCQDMTPQKGRSIWLLTLKNRGLGEDEYGIFKHLEVMIESYLASDKLLVSMPAENSDELGKAPFVDEMVTYGAEHKLDRSIKEKQKWSQPGFGNAVNKEKIPTIIFLFDGYPTSYGQADVVNLLKTMDARPEIISPVTIKADVDVDELKILAELESIKWIEVEPTYKVYNDVVSSIVDSGIVFNDLNLNGSGQVVAILDSGIDSGVDNGTMHDDLEGRINKIINYYGAAADDNSGHGTHVAGTFVGTGAMSGGKYRGIVPDAELVFQAAGDNAGTDAIFPPSNLITALQYAFNNDARVHSNSWGADLKGAYNTRSRDVDDFIWDNNNFTVVVAAGNEGPLSTTIIAPGTAKNAITVGATENLRPGKGLSGDNIDHLYSFTSIGPTIDGRIKPDVVAPGTWILSTRVNKSLVAENTSLFWEEFNDHYAYAGGTSMATPVVAGAATMLRQYFMGSHEHEPSAALIKAALINGAEDIGASDVPNNNEGWGRINLSRSLSHNTGTNYKYVDNSAGLEDDQQIMFQYDVMDSSKPIRVTLVWSDYMGDPGFDGELINDLNLLVENNGTGKFMGNNFKSGWSDPNNTVADINNNVECVFIKNPLVGRYNITVNASVITQGSQNFALFVSGALRTEDILPPAGLHLTSEAVGSELNLTWWPNEAGNITGYRVFRSNVTPDDFQFVNNVAQAGEPYYHDMNLQNNVPYYYRIKAVANSQFESVFSDIIMGIPGDSMAPLLTVSYPSDNARVRNNITLDYTAENDTLYVKFDYYIDSNGDDSANDNNSWDEIGTDVSPEDPYYWDTTNVGSGPGDANHVILKAVAFDSEGNNFTVLVVGIEVDNAAPGAPTLSPLSPNPGNEREVFIKGISEKNSLVAIYNNGIFAGDSVANGSGFFSVGINLTEGINNLTAHATDDIGNGPGLTSSILTVIFDGTPSVVVTGGPYIVNIGTAFSLNASGSYDSGNVAYHYITNFTWIITKELLTYYFGERAIIVLDEFGTYSVTLTVRDAAGNAASDGTEIIVTDTIAPSADAGENGTVNEDMWMQIDGGNSRDNDPDFQTTGIFKWEITNPSNNTFVTFGKTLNYIFYDLGNYSISLYVTDAHNNTGIDRIYINVNDVTPPTPASGGNRTVIEFHPMVLNASMSIDNDPQFITSGKFKWEFKDSGIDIILTGKIVTYTFSVLGKFEITLSVTDPSGNTGTDVFYIEVINDIDPPEIVSYYPGDFATEVKLNAEISVTFSEVIKSLSISNQNFFVFDSSSLVIPGTLFYNAGNLMAIFTPLLNLSSNEVYTVNVGNTILDLAGNNLAGNRSWIFSTVSPPLISGIQPTPSASGVKTTAKILVLFNEPLNPATVVPDTLVVTDSDGNNIVGFVVYDEETFAVTFKPKTKLEYKTEYQVVLHETVSDQAGNFLEENLTWYFTTGSEQDTANTNSNRVFLAVTFAVLFLIIIIAVLVGTGTLSVDKYFKKKSDDDLEDDEDELPQPPPPPGAMGNGKLKSTRVRKHRTGVESEDHDDRLDELDEDQQEEWPSDDIDSEESDVIDIEWEADDDFIPPSKPPAPAGSTTRKKKKKRRL